MKNHMLSPTAPAARRRRPLGTTWGKSAAGGRQPPVGRTRPPFASLPPAQSHPDCRSRLILIVARQQGALTRFFPCHIGLPQLVTGSAEPQHSAQRLRSGSNLRGCSHSIIFRPPSLLPPRSVPPLDIHSGRQGGRGVYIRAERGSLPSRASDMLAVRNRAIDGRGLSPPRPAALLAAPTRIASPPRTDPGVRC